MAGLVEVSGGEETHPPEQREGKGGTGNSPIHHLKHSPLTTSLIKMIPSLRLQVVDVATFGVQFDSIFPGNNFASDVDIR